MADNISFKVIAQDEATSTLNKIRKNVDSFSSTINNNWKKLKAWAEQNKQNFQNMRNYWAVVFAWLTYAMKDVVDEASNIQSALVWLKSIVKGTWQNFWEAEKFLKRYTEDWLVPMANATTALKNLLARWFWLEEATVLMNRFKDSASFWRQATYSLWEAVQTATEWLKNENSILVDNAWVTKNVAKMREDWGREHWVATNDMTLAQKRLAEYNGIIEETKFQVWDSVKYLDTYAWKQSQLAKSRLDMKVALWEIFMPIFSKFFDMVKPVIDNIKEWAIKNPELAKTIWLIAVWLVWLVTIIGALGVALPSIITWFTLLTWPVWLVSIAIWWLAIWFYNLFNNFPTYDEQVQSLNKQLDDLHKQYEAWWLTLQQYKEQSAQVTNRIWELETKSKTFRGTMRNDLAETVSNIKQTPAFLSETFAAIWAAFDWLVIKVVAWNERIRIAIIERFNWLWSSTKTRFSKMIASFNEWLGSIWSAWTNAMNWIWNITKSIRESIKSSIATWINWVIDRINYVIWMANWISSKVWLGKIQTINHVAFADWWVAEWWFKAFANWWIVDKPTMWLVWEWKYNEAIVPLPNWRSIPVEMRWWGGGWVIINIWSLYWTDRETADKFWNMIVQKFKGQYLFEQF